MKKFFLCTLLLIFSTGLYAQFSGSGSGTSNDPYIITNGDELNQIRFFLNNPNVYLKIVNDIELKTWIVDNNPTQGWAPIGNSATSRFMGVLDGNSFAIKNFFVNRPTTNYIGLFGYTENATIKNIKFIDGSVKGLQYVGAVVGYATNTKFNSITSNLIITGFGSDVGGIVGAAKNSFLSKIVVNSVITGENNVGCLIGTFLYNLYSTINPGNGIKNNDITGNSVGIENVGVLIGYCSIEYSNYEIIISQNSVSGNSIGKNKVGGVIGYLIDANHASDFTISENYFSGNVGGDNNIGGIVGELQQPGIQYDFKLINNYTSGHIKGINNVGGIAGFLTCKTSKAKFISNNYSFADIESSGNCAGGIIGSSLSQNLAISNNVVMSPSIMSISKTNRICGETGWASHNFSNNYAWVKTSVIENGEVKQIVEDDLNGLNSGLSSLKNKTTYQGLGFDFTNIWNISNTESFPFFIWQTPPAEFTNEAFKAGSITVSGKCATGASITLKVNDISYKTVASGNIWSIVVPKLKVNDELSVTAQVSDKWHSYQVNETVQLNGDGTLINPYKIYTETDLKSIFDLGANYLLMNDIELTNTWVSIGTAANSLRGSFNGNNHIISNLYISADVASLFFQVASTATIKNLNVKASTSKQILGKTHTSGIVAINNGTIDSCSFTGNLVNPFFSTPVGESIPNCYIGGITAINKGNVLNSSSFGDKTSTSKSIYIGGLVGYNYGIISQSFSVGDINVSEEKNSADIFAQWSGAPSFVGGLAGYNKGSVDNAYASGSFSSTAHLTNAVPEYYINYVGGLIGINEGDISNTYTIGNVHAAGEICYAGGLVAYNTKKTELSYTNVNVSSNYRASGLVGYNVGTTASTKNCVALGRSVSGKNSINRIVGGFANNAPNPTVTDNYANKDMIVTVNGNIMSITDNFMQGTGKSLDQLKLQTNYSTLSFDFNTIWHIKGSVTFPYLFNIQSAPPEIVTPVYSGSSVAITGSHLENGSSVKVWTNKNSSAKYNTVVNGKWSVILDILNPNDSIFATASTGSKGESFAINTIAAASTYTISASANPNIGGSFSGAITYNSGETATLIATPNAGYKFIAWTENSLSVSTNPSYSFTVNANRSLVANFILNTGIGDQLQTDIRIYPNPVQDVLHIESPESKVLSVSVFDYLGRQLITTREKTVNISHLKPGIYLVKVNDKMFKIAKE